VTLDQKNPIRVYLCRGLTEIFRAASPRPCHPADSGRTANQRTVARPPHLSSPLTILPVDINRYIMNKCSQPANRDNERADGNFNKHGSPIFRRRISEEPSSCSLTAQHLGGYDGLAVAARALGSDLAALTSA
jgi:hypothetical protein